MNTATATNDTVRFSSANSKIAKLAKRRGLRKFLRGGRKIFSFDLLAGVSCPGALDCKAHAAERPDGTRYVVHGRDAILACFDAAMEARLPNVFRLRKQNFGALRGKTEDEIVQILRGAFPVNAAIVRIHTSGDFFSADYFRAWMTIIRENPTVRFYCYTKSLRILADNLALVPENLKVTLSAGGRYDSLIASMPQFPVARVVNYEHEAEQLGLEIDRDDSHAAFAEQSFALLIHGGAQPAGSEAARAVAAQRRK
jgi:hypothetical protein